MSGTPALAVPRFPKGRRWKKVRFPGGPDLTAWLHTQPDELPAKAAVRNLSGFGISLFLNRDLEPGALITVDLVNATTAYHCQAPMRILSSVVQPDNQFLVEGLFARELRNVEIQGLLPEALG